MNIQNKTEKPNKNQNAPFRIMLLGTSVMVAAALLCAFYFSVKMQQVGVPEEQNDEVYDKHYAFITDDTEEEFWDEVYAGASEEAEKGNVYVERLGENLERNDYTTTDLLRVAINSSVDGIIFCGQDDEETVELINEAVAKGIFVVTLRQDIDDSDRQCFVGVNSYDLGLEYGKQLLELLEPEEMEDRRIYILMEDTATESSQNLITLAIKDSLAETSEEGAAQPEIEIIKIDTLDAFSAEEAIRDILLDEQNIPDIMVCLNSIYTECAYQAAVDYNRVGDVKILGYYSSDAILEAIEKQIIYSTVNVDTEEMGHQCIKSLKEYEETGYASSYVPVSTQVIDRAQVEKMLQEEEKQDAGN